MKKSATLLRDKLITLGYNSISINAALDKLDLTVVDNRIEQLDESKIEENIFVIKEYSEPNVDIIQTFLNIGEEMLGCSVLEGDITPSSTESAVKTRIPTADYTLSKRNAIVGVTADGKIKIVRYVPSQKTMNMYNNMTYEQIYKPERDAITKDYYEAFLNSKKIVLNDRKVRDILTMLLSDFVIDDMAVNDLNPLIRNYDTPAKYAESLNAYSIRYINTKTNRLEIFERDVQIKIKSKNVSVGIVTNDPYVKINELPPKVDFPLNHISYYWSEKSRGSQGEIAIFVATRSSEKSMYSELFEDDAKVDNVAKEILRRSRLESSQELDVNVLRDILLKLNPELVCPSTDLIYNNLQVRTDTFEPLRYRYRIITDPAEFEERLYVTIEDNVGRRYKYKLVENVLDDNTKIGTKLEYTDRKGNVVRKQSIADFNVNAMAVIIKRETIIDDSCIPDLLGYIYEDVNYSGADSLPVPNIEVDIYIPLGNPDKRQIVMFNGTNVGGNVNQETEDSFFGNSQGDFSGSTSYIASSANALPGSTTLTVRYVNSKGVVLKENRIGNLFPNTIYIPDVIPIINDSEGKEWLIENENPANFVVQTDPSQNVIEIKYIERYARVHISIINRDGKNLTEEKSEIWQVGSVFDMESKSHFTDEKGDEWKLKSARPSRLVISDDEQRNKIILVYDIDRADVVVKYLNKNGKEIAPPQIIQSAVGKMCRAQSVPYIVDMDGLGWLYSEASVDYIVVQSGVNNEINLLYDEAKQKVITKVIDENGNNLVDEEVSFVQIGKTHSVKFEKMLYDYECKEWEYRNAIADSIIVNSDESQNILQAVYKPRLAKASLKFIREDGRAIRDAVFEEAQIGGIFNYASRNEISDNFGKIWTLIDAGKSIVISENVQENVVTLKYEPLMAKVTVKYFDAESKELIPPKTQVVQAGTQYKNDPIKKITGKDGKKWVIDESKIPTLVVGKHEEENVVSIYYDKETTNVRISFYDAFGNVLLEEKELPWQIGAEYDTNTLYKITDMNGQRWMLENTEPKILTVREQGNKFKFIYGEVKAKILVKHIDVKTQKSVVEDIITTVALGGIYVPNIRQRLIDKNKWEWNYIGDENINIVAKENEQENIIVLNYEERRAPVLMKYQNKDGQQLKPDVTKDVQVGKEIRIDAANKFNDSKGIGWKFVKSNMDSQIVKEDGNLVVNIYEPLLGKIIIKYVDEENKEITTAKEEKIQVGKRYKLDIQKVIANKDGAKWEYKTASMPEFVVKDGDNVVTCKYEKLLSEVTISYVDEDGDLIAPEVINKYQVGTNVEVRVKQNFVDPDGKAWLFTEINESKLVVSENEEENKIIISYKKDLAEVRMEFFNKELQQIASWKTIKAQIGSTFSPTAQLVIVDENKMGWLIDQESLKPLKVSRKPNENTISVLYDKYIVDVTIYYKDAAENDIIKPKVERVQVGTEFLPKIEEYVEDEFGREWIADCRIENKLFGGGKKIDPLPVTVKLDQNFTKLYYKPSMNKVVVRYVDPLGAEIKQYDEYEAQIGSNYTPEIIEKISGASNKKWTYNVNSKATIRVSKDVKENIVVLAYEQEKAFVIYQYKDQDNNKLKEPKKVLAQIGSAHKISPDNVIESSDGRVWEFKAANKEEILVNEEDKNNVIEFLYVPLKVNVNLRFITKNGNSIMKDKIVKAQLGSVFKPDIDQRISDEESKQYKFVKCEPQTIKVKEVPLGSNQVINFFDLTYESLVTKVKVSFQDIDGNKLKDDMEIDMPVGTVYRQDPIRFVTDRNGIQWQLLNDNIDPITVKEDNRENEIIMTYEVAKAEISIRYKDTEGNTIKKTDLLNLEVGSEFVPEVEKEFVDEQNRRWLYNRTEPIKLTVGSINNIINVIYQEKKAIVTIKLQTADGRTLKDDVIVKAQIGTRFAPKPVIKVIYDNNNDTWRYSHNNPSDIIVDENPIENVVIQYFTADNFGEKKPENKAYFNPDAQKFIDADLVAQVEAEEAEKLRLEEEEKERKALEDAQKEPEAVFTDPYLQALGRSVVLKNDEIVTINQLNDYNTEIVAYLREALRWEGSMEEYGLAEKLSAVIRKEKQLVEEGLKDIIAEDKTGNKILKIFEAITNSEIDDRDFYFLDQRKAVLFADYFVDNKVTTQEEANYIIMRGKNKQGLEIVKDASGGHSLPNTDLRKLRIILIYESVMLDNYYRARSVAKDNYFDSPASRAEMDNDVVIMVTNLLPKQALRLLSRHASLTLAQYNELEATLLLLNQQQINGLITEINRIPDGKERKIQLKLFKELTGMK